jgi:hypothetical protein
MNEDILFRYILRVLRQLRIPFIDPCDEDYQGDCICGTSGNSGEPVTPTFTAGTSILTLPNPVTGNPQVFIGGQKIHHSRLTIVGNTITILDYTLATGEEVEVIV